MPGSHTYIRLAWLLLAALLAGCGGGGSGGGGGGQGNAAPPAATPVDDILDDALRSDIAGIIAYIEEGGDSARLYAAGIDDRASGQPARSGALFKIASISKLFVAAAVAKLAEQGLLHPDDSLASWLPELAGDIANADAVTIRQLVRHRSGIPDFDSQAGFSWQRAHTDTAATLDFIRGKPADFAPDARYEYSNSNYLLLGLVMDRALGYSHRDYIRNAIIDPLGLNETYPSATDVDPDALMKGYWDGRERSGQLYDITGGSMISTADNVGRFVRELNRTGTLFTAAERSRYRELYGSGHSGWLPGYQSEARFISGLDAVIVLLVNTTGGDSEETLADTYDRIEALLRAN